MFAHQFLVNPLGAFGQKLEVRICMDVQNIDQLCLKQSSNVHPLFMNLLDSVNIIIFIIALFSKSEKIVKLLYVFSSHKINIFLKSCQIALIFFFKNCKSKIVKL